MEGRTERKLLMNGKGDAMGGEETTTTSSYGLFYLKCSLLPDHDDRSCLSLNEMR